MRRRLFLAVVTGLLLVPGFVDAQPTVKREPPQRVFSVDGADNYRQYCAACHGKAGRGDGPAAPALKVPPTDLTTFAQRHGGTFDTAELRQHMDGERTVPAHGSREMPIWGEVFRALDDEQSIRELRIRNLLAHLKSLQVPAR